MHRNIFFLLVVIKVSNGLRFEQNTDQDDEYSRPKKTADVRTEESFQVPGYPITLNPQVSHFAGKTYLLINPGCDRDDQCNQLNQFMLAHNFCLIFGMELLVFQSKREFDFLQELLPKFDYSSEETRVWIAVTDMLNPGNFTNLYTGQEFTTFFNEGPKLKDKKKDSCISLDHKLDKKKKPSNLSVGYQDCDTTLNVVCTTGVLDYEINCCN